MKTKLLFLSFFMLTTLISRAQDIAVQAPDNNTVIYHDLNKAIYFAPTGSTVFLPAGPLSINDTTLIKKTLNIIGVGHRSDTEGGNTVVNGNFNFRTGSDGSSLMGIYLSGNVNIADVNGSVNNFLLKFCNVNTVQVANSLCNALLVNQNYIRSTCNCGNASIEFSNNVMHSISDLNSGMVKNNYLLNGVWWVSGWTGHSTIFYNVNNSTIINNVFKLYLDGYYNSILSGTNCLIFNNMGESSIGSNYITVTDWSNIFLNTDYNINPLNNFHFKTNIGKNAGTDGTDVGIYGGTGFSDTALPPYPQIVFKNIPAQTDAFGNLKIQVKVKAQ